MSTILAILLHVLWTFPTSFSIRSTIEVAEVDVMKVHDILIEECSNFWALHYTNAAKCYYNVPNHPRTKVSQQFHEINIISDDVGCFSNFSYFWYERHAIDCVSKVQLFSSGENLRSIPSFIGHPMTVIDSIEGNLWNSKNVSIEQLHRSLRPRLRCSVKIIQQCTHVNSTAKDLISEFLTYVTPTCAFAESRCPKGKATTTDSFGGTCPSVADNKEKNWLTAASTVVKDTNTVSVVQGIPVSSRCHVGKIFPTTDGLFEESDEIEIIYDFKPTPVSRKLVADETGKECKLSKNWHKFPPIPEFINMNEPNLLKTSTVEPVRPMIGRSAKDVEISSKSAQTDGVMQVRELRDVENLFMRKRSMISKENMTTALGKEETTCTEPSLLLYVCTRHSELSLPSTTSTSLIVNRSKKRTLFAATKIAACRKTSREMSRTTTIPMSTKKAKINKVGPRKTGILMEHRSAQRGRKVFNKKLPRSQYLYFNNASRNKSDTQIYGCSPHRENIRSPARRRCPEGKRDSFARCANKDSSEKPEVVPRFEELRMQRFEHTRTDGESSSKEFRKDALCQGLNYRFNQDKTLDRDTNISTYYTGLNVNDCGCPLLVKARKSKRRNKNGTVNDNEIFDLKKWKYLYNARQTTTDRLKVTYKLLKERHTGYYKKEKKTSTLPLFNPCEILAPNKSVRNVVVTIQDFFEKNASGMRRIESRRKRKLTMRRRQRQIFRPKKRKHHKIHVKSHTRKSVVGHQNRRRKLTRRHVAVK